MQKTALFVLWWSLFAASPLVRADALISPASENVANGSSFTDPVTISSVTDLYDFQFDLTFDPTILQLTSVTAGPFLSSGGGATFFFPGFIDNIAGTATFVADTLVGPISGVTGGGTLVNLNFHAISLGSSNLTLSNVILQDSAANDLAFTMAPGHVTVLSAVPEPALLWPLAALLFAVLILPCRSAAI